MTSGRETVERLLLAVSGEVEPPESQLSAIARLRKLSLDPPVIVWLMEIGEDNAKSIQFRRSALQTLGFHRPWRSLDLFHDDRIHALPDRLALLVENQKADSAVRDAALSAIGWQYLSDKQLWPKLLSDADPYLRQNALFELLRNPDRDTVSMVIRHLSIETEPIVRNAVLWGLAQHPHFYEVALSLLIRTDGALFSQTITEACGTDLQVAARALQNAEMKHFEVRETLLQRLFENVDEQRIACLLSLIQDGRAGFALRRLRAVDEQSVNAVISQLDRSVHSQKSAEWTDEAAKLLLHYWDRFDSWRSTIEKLLGEWRSYCPKVSHLAMSRDIRF